MRRTALLAAALSLSSSPALADPEVELASERTVDLASGMTIAEPTASGDDFRPGVAVAARFYAASHLYASGALGASVASTDGPDGTGLAATLLTVAGGAGLWGEHGAWTGYAGARAEWVRNIDWPDAASRDPDWFTSGVGAGPSLGLARRIGYAWRHPMAIELTASYLVYSLRRPEVDVIQILPAHEPAPVELDGLQVGVFLTGTLFPDRPL